MGAAKRLDTFDDLYARIAALPEGETGEILDPGVLRVMSRPGPKHRAASKRLLRLLGALDRDSGGGWWIDSEPEVRLRERLYVPDVAGWRVAVDEPLTFLEESPITLPPDWACEILSRTTQRGDRGAKLPHYAAAGVGHVWIADPEAALIEVYESTPRGALLVASVSGAERRALPPFDLPLVPAELFALSGP